jgi:hypothetical protein
VRAGRAARQACLAKLLLFDKLEPALQQRLVADMYERKVLVRSACALPGTSLQLRPCHLLAVETSRGLWSCVPPL